MGWGRCPLVHGIVPGAPDSQPRAPAEDSCLDHGDSLGHPCRTEAADGPVSNRGTALANLIDGPRGQSSIAANTSGPGRPQRWPTPPLHLIQTRLGRASSGVRLVISDDHRGLVKAVGEQLWVLRGSAVASTSPGTPATSSPARRGAWSRPSPGRSSSKPDEASARAQLRRVVDGLEARFPAVASGQHQDVAQDPWA